MRKIVICLALTLCGLLVGAACAAKGSNDVTLTESNLEFFFSSQWSGGDALQELLDFTHRPSGCTVTSITASTGELKVEFSCP